MEKITIFIINLKKDIDRKAHLITICKKHNLDYRFIEAVNGNLLDKSEINEIYSEEKAIKQIGKPLTKGEIGCALSHLSIYKTMVKENIEKAIIFEDDIDIDDNFNKVIKHIDNLQKDWELVLLGYNAYIKKEEDNISSYRYQKTLVEHYKSVRLLDKAYSAYAYLLNLKGAKKLIGYLETLTQPIDYLTGDENYINVYALKPRIVRVNPQLDITSNLQDEREKIHKEYNTLNSQENVEKKTKKVSILKNILKKLGIGKLKRLIIRLKSIKPYK
jgi:glycosyl transferase family 25